MNDQIQEINDLKESVDWSKQNGYSGFQITLATAEALLSEVERLQTERKEMEGVLKWYANKDNYDPGHLDTFGFIPIDKDEGKRASEALSHLKG
ncbi:hypothetical protein D3C76_336040 [compost metagenome]